MNNLSVKILKEAKEELSEAELEEYSQYLYEEADGDIDNIPDYERTTDYIFYCTTILCLINSYSVY